MYVILLYSILCLTRIEAERILIFVPTPSISHQVVFYPFIEELLKRGHEIVYLTTDPIYPRGKAPENLTEIDTHDISYKILRDIFLDSGSTKGVKEDQYDQLVLIFSLTVKVFEQQAMTPQFQDLVKKKPHFDLIIAEPFIKSGLSLSHVFKAPMILMSSFGSLDNYQFVGAPIHPRLLYPRFFHQKLNNMTIVDKIRVLWNIYKIEWFISGLMVEENKLVKRLFGSDIPTLEELGNNVHMFFMNVYPIWEMNRPVPPSVVFIGGIHQKPRKELPEDLQTYLDLSQRGVVYFSLGTNVNPSRLPPEKIRVLINALSKLSYDVLLKWDNEELPGAESNIKIAKWLPQSDLLQHPNIKAFVTQGGLQSFDEALTGGVPLVGIPMLGDQWFNVEMYVSLKIGVGLLMEELTEDKLVEAVNTVINEPNYRINMKQLRDKLRDQPQTGLERAVWWTEHVLRHKGARHLRAPAANMSWTEYLDLELMAVLALAALLALGAAATTLYFIVRFAKRILIVSIKSKIA